MHVPPLVYDLAKYVSLAIAVISLLWLAVRGSLEQAKRHGLPVAIAALMLSKRGLSRWGPPVGLVAGGAAAFLMWWQHCDVVFVRDGDHGPEITRRVWIGGTPPYYASQRLAYTARNPTWIVNESAWTLSAQQLGYGDSHTWRPIAIAPQTECVAASVDYIGPYDVPPDVITVTRDREIADAGIPASESRVWLTWDDRSDPRVSR
jgi:hypothetical protein